MSNLDLVMDTDDDGEDCAERFAEDISALCSCCDVRSVVEGTVQGENTTEEMKNNMLPSLMIALGGKGSAQEKYDSLLETLNRFSFDSVGFQPDLDRHVEVSLMCEDVGHRVRLPTSRQWYPHRSVLVRLYRLGFETEWSSTWTAVDFVDVAIEWCLRDGKTPLFRARLDTRCQLAHTFFSHPVQLSFRKLQELSAESFEQGKTAVNCDTFAKRLFSAIATTCGIDIRFYALLSQYSFFATTLLICQADVGLVPALLYAVGRSMYVSMSHHHRVMQGVAPTTTRFGFEMVSPLLDLFMHIWVDVQGLAGYKIPFSAISNQSHKKLLQGMVLQDVKQAYGITPEKTDKNNLAKDVYRHLWFSSQIRPRKLCIASMLLRLLILQTLPLRCAMAAAFTVPLIGAALFVKPELQCTASPCIAHSWK